MNRNACTTCGKSSITFCSANERLCSAMESESKTCPYSSCREDVLFVTIYEFLVPILSLFLFIILAHTIIIFVSILHTQKPIVDRLQIKVIPVNTIPVHPTAQNTNRDGVGERKMTNDYQIRERLEREVSDNILAIE